MSDSLPPPPSARSDDQALQYTHSGGRYLLGYGDSFFGIWDRTRPDAPPERFPRTSEGWHTAWIRFVALEPSRADVGLGTAPATTGQARPAEQAPPAGPPPRASAGRPGHPAWWLLPILMGWMGGLLAWLLIRDQDPGRARAMLVVGIAATIFWIVVYSMVLPAPTS